MAWRRAPAGTEPTPAIPVIWVGRAPWDRSGDGPDGLIHVHRAESLMLLPDCLEKLPGQPRLAIRERSQVTCPSCQALLVARFLREED